MFANCPRCGFLVALDDQGRPLPNCPGCGLVLREGGWRGAAEPPEEADDDAPGPVQVGAEAPPAGDAGAGARIEDAEATSQPGIDGTADAAHAVGPASGAQARPVDTAASQDDVPAGHDAVHDAAARIVEASPPRSDDEADADVVCEAMQRDVPLEAELLPPRRREPGDEPTAIARDGAEDGDRSEPMPAAHDNVSLVAATPVTPDAESGAEPTSDDAEDQSGSGTSPVATPEVAMEQSEPAHAQGAQPAPERASREPPGSADRTGSAPSAAIVRDSPRRSRWWLADRLLPRAWRRARPERSPAAAEPPATPSMATPEPETASMAEPDITHASAPEAAIPLIVAPSGTAPSTEPEPCPALSTAPEASAPSAAPEPSAPTARLEAPAPATEPPAAVPARATPRPPPRRGHAVPSFARGAAAPQVRDRRRTLLRGAAILGLSLLLALQLLLSDRAALAADARWRPLLAMLCGGLGCELPPWREPQAFRVVERDVRATHPGVLRVSARVRNDARWPQPWPILVLTLSDANGQRVAMREFLPRDYHGGAPTSSQLASGQTVALSMDIVEPGPQAVAFTFDFK